MKLIYGSTAIKYWFPDFREPKDLDIISDYYIKDNKNEDISWIDEFLYLKVWNKDKVYVDPNFLYTIKISHLSWNIWNWDKHMRDAIFLKEKWCSVDYEFYKLLMRWWNRVHWKKRVKMWVQNNCFFKKNIIRKYDHDWLHEQYSFYDRPLNEQIREDLNSPLCSEKLWNKLSYDDKLKCALEELYVLTTERYIFIDNPYKLEFAKTKMLKQMIISTTSGWFNLFLKENFNELRLLNPPHIINKINYLKNKIWMKENI